MKNTQKGFVIPLLIFIIVLMIAGLLLWWFLYAKKQPKESLLDTGQPVELSGKATDDWKMYTNGAYGFRFNYPKEFDNLFADDIAKVGACETIENGHDSYISGEQLATVKYFQVAVVCEKLSGSTGIASSTIAYGPIPPELKDTVTPLTVSGRSGYQHEFRDPSGNHWRIAQIPINDNQYAEITYVKEYATNNQAAHDLSDDNWKTILSSFTVADRYESGDGSYINVFKNDDGQALIYGNAVYTNVGGSENEGYLEATTTIGKDGKAHYESSEWAVEGEQPCIIDFQFSGDKLTLKTQNTLSCGWGHNVDFEGEYTKRP